MARNWSVGNAPLAPHARLPHQYILLRDNNATLNTQGKPKRKGHLTLSRPIFWANLSARPLSFVSGQEVGELYVGGNVCWWCSAHRPIKQRTRARAGGKVNPFTSFQGILEPTSPFSDSRGIVAYVATFYIDICSYSLNSITQTLLRYISNMNRLIITSVSWQSGQICLLYLWF